MAISIQATANPAANTIKLEIADENGKATFELDMHQVVHMFAALTQALQGILSSNRTEQLSELPPAVRARPSYQIASSPEGDLVLILQATPLPPFHFLFRDDAVSDLRSQLEQFLAIPRPMRYQRPH